MSDDEIIGLKSTLLNSKNIKTFVSFSYLINLSILIFLFKSLLGINIFSLLILMFILSLLFQILKFKKVIQNHVWKLLSLTTFPDLFYS